MMRTSSERQLSHGTVFRYFRLPEEKAAAMITDSLYKRFIRWSNERRAPFTIAVIKTELRLKWSVSRELLQLAIDKGDVYRPRRSFGAAGGWRRLLPSDTSALAKKLLSRRK